LFKIKVVREKSKRKESSKNIGKMGNGVWLMENWSFGEKLKIR
jgi:hypothetical protein